ncbi:hypothetical protein QAD02_018885 [Eretmocerus hayati]|uniref:Uncharacterized protein n=1 Tax=Eretmocerus hayati TaxID=131215 RepID=A0ACC2PI18_9HYME|nr:hypothetical protein QAD02_018885 [Eretmocerus hayati]
MSNHHGASYNDIRRMTVMIERIQGVRCHYEAYAVQTGHRITASRIGIPVAPHDNDGNIIGAETDIIEMERQCRLALDEASNAFHRLEEYQRGMPPQNKRTYVFLHEVINEEELEQGKGINRVKYAHDRLQLSTNTQGHFNPQS